MNERVTIAILAAGSASRFGGGKLDALFQGKYVGSYAVNCASRIGRPLIITASAPPQFALEADEAGSADLLENPGAKEGLSTSLALAAQKAKADESDRLLLLLADMPLVRPETLEALLGQCSADIPSAVLYPNGRPGVPACFPASWFGKLMKVTGDKGAASLLGGDPMVRLVEVDPSELRDVDRPEDLNA